MPPTAAMWSPGDHTSLPQLDTDPTAQQRPSHVTLTPSSVPMNSRERPRSRPSPVDGYTQRPTGSGSSVDTAPDSPPARLPFTGRETCACPVTCCPAAGVAHSWSTATEPAPSPHIWHEGRRRLRQIGPRPATERLHWPPPPGS